MQLDDERNTHNVSWLWRQCGGAGRVRLKEEIHLSSMRLPQSKIPWTGIDMRLKGHEEAAPENRLGFVA